MFCLRCISLGFCPKVFSTVFSDSELSRDHFLADFRTFLVRYSFEQRLLPSQWHDHLCGLYRDYRGWIKDREGSEVFLNMEVFEHPNIREWFRDFIRPISPGVHPRLRAETKERVRVFATIMRAHFPEEAMMWGVRAANDN